MGDEQRRCQQEFGRAIYEIDSDPQRLDLALVHRFLSGSAHWARGIPRAVLERAIAHSIVFGLYRDGEQLGFARVVSDHATFAYLTDVFVVPAERNRGLGQWLVEQILAHPPLAGMRRWLLGTRDAQSLYRRCGFAEPPAGFWFMERLDRAVYAPAPARAADASNPEELPEKSHGRAGAIAADDRRLPVRRGALPAERRA